MGPKKNKSPLFEPKDMVLAKMTGFPAWPSFVMPPEMIPAPILRAKKKTTNTCVIFIPDGDFNWMNEKSLEVLSREKLRAKLDKAPKDKARPKTKKKSTRTNNVLDALVAANDLEFDEFMADLDRAKALLDEDDDEAEEAQDDEIENEDGAEDEKEVVRENVLPTDKVSEKLDNGETENGEDESADKEASLVSPKAPQRQTKTESARGTRKSTRSNPKPAETELPGNGGPSHELEEDESSKSEKGIESLDEKELVQKSATRKRTRGGRVTKPLTPDSSEPKSANGAEIEADPEEPTPKRSAADTRVDSPKPASDKDRRQQLWLCRIRLQRSLIQRNQPVTPKDPKSFPPPTDEELSVAKAIMVKLVDFPVTVELLRFTKIHKVLKCLLKDPDLELPGTYELHELCKNLLTKWHDSIEILRQTKALRPESRIGSSAPEDSEISGMEIKPSLERSYAAKLET